MRAANGKEVNSTLMIHMSLHHNTHVPDGIDLTCVVYETTNTEKGDSTDKDKNESEEGYCCRRRGTS